MTGNNNVDMEAEEKKHLKMLSESCVFYSTIILLSIRDQK